MQCANCGYDNSQSNRFCVRCGVDLAAAPPPDAPASPGRPESAPPTPEHPSPAPAPPNPWGAPAPAGQWPAPGAASPSPVPPSPAPPPPGSAPPNPFAPPAPYGPPGAYPPPGPYGQYPLPYPPSGYQPVATNGLAIASFILGLVGWMACGVGSIVAVVLGFVARSQIRGSQGHQGGDGLALAGIILGFLAIALVIAFFVIGTLANSTTGQY